MGNDADYKGFKVENISMADTSSVLQIRLNTEYILHKIKIYLTGKIETIVYDEQRNPQIKVEEIAYPKANPTGVHEILCLVENIINPQTVQGNFVDRTDYENYIYEAHDTLLTDLMCNLEFWGIKEDDYEPICNKIMLLIIPFMSRLIGNKERDSYGNFKVIESETHLSGKNRGELIK